MLFPTVSLSAAIFAGLTVAQFNGLPTCAVSLPVFAHLPYHSRAQMSCMPPEPLVIDRKSHSPCRC